MRTIQKGIIILGTLLLPFIANADVTAVQCDDQLGNAQFTWQGEVTYSCGAPRVDINRDGYVQIAAYGTCSTAAHKYPDSNGYSDWMDTLKIGLSNNQLVCGFQAQGAKKK